MHRSSCQFKPAVAELSRPPIQTASGVAWCEASRETLEQQVAALGLEKKTLMEQAQASHQQTQAVQQELDREREAKRALDSERWADRAASTKAGEALQVSEAARADLGGLVYLFLVHVSICVDSFAIHVGN